MKHGRRYKKDTKKKLLKSMLSISAVIMLIVGIRLADISMPIKNSQKYNAQIISDEEDVNKNRNNKNENNEEIVIENSMKVSAVAETGTTTYIYNASDLVEFRNNVNSGNDYAGKTVRLMNDIDLSSVCSSTKGSWVPIGATGTYFAGTFEGNYHTIKNLYINSGTYIDEGLFSRIPATATIQNLILENPIVNNTYNQVTTTTYTGAILSINYGAVKNCGVEKGENGSISATKTSVNTSSGWPGTFVGGVASMNYGLISGCYNKANVSGYAPTSRSGNEAYVGGITAGNYKYLENCYNTGNITGSANGIMAGGVQGGTEGGSGVSTYTKNSYNIGSVSASGSYAYVGGVMGRSGWSSSCYAVHPTNCFTTTTTSYAYYYYSGSVYGSSTGRVASATLQTYTVQLGNAFAYDVYNKNSGYPVLAWENITPIKPTMTFNKKQEYINVGERIQLNILKDDAVGRVISNNYNASNFIWKSTNEDIATVDNNGVVTGIKDGYTTIYAYNESSKLYAMCIINVSKSKAIPQIGTGDKFTAILRADGTVWTIGNNTNGTLGNGTEENTNQPVQVKIDEDTNLQNVIKISVGTDHILALTRAGNVYAWGLNTYGQLGQNNTETQKYAKIVLGENGTSYLSNIIDISAGANGSIALDQNGNVYVWGKGTTGEIGNNATETKQLPTKTTVKNGIQVNIGVGTVGVLTSDGSLWSWGQNTNGELGINCTANTTYPMKTAIDVTEVSLGGYHTTIKKVDGTVYAVGSNGYGRLGTNNTTNAIKYVKVNLPNTVATTNKVKYIRAGIINTTLVLTDGSIWETGFNLQGELGNGTTTHSTEFVQGLVANDTPLENVLTVGRNNGTMSGSDTTGYGLNTAVILKNGDIYSTGDNSYGQLGDYTTNNSSYYIKMGQDAYLTYKDSTVELSSKETYQIDKQKLQYIYRSFNVYTNEKYVINNLKYTSLDDKVATVDNNGIVTAKEISSGLTKIKIEDVDNGFETYMTVIVNKMQNTDKVTYIYSANDLVKFRDSVNNGDDYKGKSVYVMADIDLKEVCSEELGSFEPIGATGTYFAGIFDGNYHTINNLYINSDEYIYSGLFTANGNTSIIQNILLEKVNIYNSYNQVQDCSYTGGIIGVNYGTVLNCGTKSGNVIGKKVSVSTGSNTWPGPRVGGIVGENEGTISGCYNKAEIEAYSPTSRYNNEVYVGGVAGASYKYLENCYNTGSVKGSSYGVMIGGITGGTHASAGNPIYVRNCYNTGEIYGSGNYVHSGGILGRTGWNGTYYAVHPTNIYCLPNVTYSYRYYNGSTPGVTTGKVEANTLKTYSTVLGNAFEDDNMNINNEFPILWWEAYTIELKQKQEYIKINEQLQLTLNLDDNMAKYLGNNVTTSDFIWASSNEEIASVNETGVVVGLKEGYTTIYGYHKDTGLYTNCIVNVSRDVAVPQIETGEGFTTILKPDGTVWAIGNNEKGTYGNGTNDKQVEPVQVKINENTYLTNVIKISVGTNHVLALTKNGMVYAWGDNTYGQLGQNDKESSKYAKPVLGEGGSGNLKEIIDISAGSYGSTAINRFGWTYTWGNGAYGETGNGTTVENLTPVKNTLNTTISVSMGTGHNVLLSQSGKVYSTGRNTYGELGTGNTANSAVLLRVEKETTEISSAGYETLIKKIDGSVLGAGLNTSNQLGIATTSNITVFTNVILPEGITSENKVKYIKAGRMKTSILTTNGEIYTVGANKVGELGNGQNINSNSFVKGLTKEGILENTIMIGRSNGETEDEHTVTINQNGRVYTAGSNIYGQIGNNKTEDENYFTQMGYSLVEYEEKIKLHVGETFNLTKDNFAYVERNFNVYREDNTRVSLINYANMLDTSVATYESGLVTGLKIGSTLLRVRVQESNADITIYIPVEVLPDEGTVVPDVKAGNDYTVTLKANGTVWSFGKNANGELGIGDNTDKNIPVKVQFNKNTTDKLVENSEEQTDKDLTESSITIEQISIGNGHTIALTTDGKVYTWGSNTNGQLGIGGTKSSNFPQLINIPVSTERTDIIKEKIIKIIASSNTSYAISNTGKVYAWGEKYKQIPQLLELDKEIIDISKNYVLDIDGNIYTLDTMERIQIVEKIKYISESDTHATFLSESGNAYSIGSNTYGQFGNGNNVSNTTEVVAMRKQDLTDILRNIVSVEAGNGYTTVLLSDGKIVQCGMNSKGQLGVQDEYERNITKENMAISKLVSDKQKDIMLMDSGYEHIVIALTDGTVYVWGAGEEGQIGNGTNDDEVNPKLVGKNIIEANTNNVLINENEKVDLKAQISYFNLLKDINGDISFESKDETVIKVDAKTGEATGISAGTTIVVAREKGTDNISVIQTRVLPTGLKVEPQVSTNGSHTVTLKADGTVWSYGSNINGELGNGKTKYSDDPVKAIFPEDTIITQVRAGENFSVALDSKGNVWTWGANDYYQLGNATYQYETKPVKVAGISNITKITAGTYNVLAIDQNKNIYGWGLNANGELGIGSYTNKIATPTKAKYITDIIDISAGKNHTIALKSTGEVYVTGLNMYGQLGNNDTRIKKVDKFIKVNNLSGIARISTTDSGNIVSTINGNVYTWGLNIYGELGLGDKKNRYVPTLVENLDKIILVEGGKNHSIILSKDGKVYTSGSCKYGQLGIGQTEERLQFTQVQTLDNVMTISAGNTYTVVAREDGTVWGFGDYNHGDKEFKSKTNSKTPMQVGNDHFSLGITKIAIRKSRTADITSSLAYSFNLIYEDKNNTEKITYESLNEEIAVVNERGEVLGVTEGCTWVKAIEEDGTTHIVYVYVIDNETDYAPEVSAGEDFADVLKADGTVWTFGHNNNGELGIGSNKTKDIPENINIISSYKEISAGDNFTIAIRNDGTVWGYGKNSYGQLGIGSTRNSVNPVQINGLTDIIQISTGKEHSIALDSYGILYGWGRNNAGQLGKEDIEIITTPVTIGYTGGTIRSIYAGENQTIIINTKGKIYGYGNILNGELAGINNAVKVSVGDGYMLILTADGEVYKYSGNILQKYTELEQIVDIDVTNTNNIAQTKDEKIYTWKSNEIPKLEKAEKVFTISVGVNNEYIVLTDGTVYARGTNKYGQLGNSTRIDSTEFTIVGNRKFEVEPENAIMYVNDIEKVLEEMTIDEFNVFNREIKNASEYIWESSDSDIVKISAEKGELIALGEGTAYITITDSVTGECVTLTRVVIPVERDRIESIKVNDDEAIVTGEYRYGVEVETNEDTGTLHIITKDKTDRISIDGGINWKENGTLIEEIELAEDETEISIIVETSNKTQIPYTLQIKKISTDVSLENITVDGKEAIPTSTTNYEIVVPEDTDLSEIIARTTSSKAEVSINGEEFKKQHSNSNIKYNSDLKVIVPVIVKAENGDELEYLLTIYKESAILTLESLQVDGNEAIKISDSVYSTVISRNITTSEIMAKAVSELVKVSINNEKSEVQISQTKVDITDELTEVTIRLSTDINGTEIYKEYTLNIYKKAETGNIGLVLVNGTVVMRNANNEYEIFLTAETKNATVKVIAQNPQDYVQIEENTRELSSSEVNVNTPENINQYTIKIIDDEDITERYTLYIKKPSLDNTLKQVMIKNGEYSVNAKLSLTEDNVYEAKVLSYDNYTVQAITNNINAKVGIEGNADYKNIAEKVIARTENYVEVLINVESENGDSRTYTLKIYVMSSDANLEFVKVNETNAVLQPDGTYLVNLETAETQVSVTAQTIDKNASVKVEDEEYEKHKTTRDVIINSKETISYIYVQAEDGTTKKYTLRIAGLPDDTTLEKVIVNGKEAKYIEGQNKYEIRLEDDKFNIEAIATDSLARVGFNTESLNIGSSTINIEKQDSVTTVTIKVEAQNGIDSKTYTLEIKEKSNDSSIASVSVNGIPAERTLNGDYITSVVNNVTLANIRVDANDSFATVYLDEETQNDNNIIVTKTITDRQSIYKIKIIAEDGTEEEHTLTITRLLNNTNIKEIVVTSTIVTANDETGELQENKVVKNATKKLDGSYYLKIPRVDNVDVKAILEDSNAQVKIKNSNYEIGENETNVAVSTEITNVLINVKAEDGTLRDYTLILEKESNDTSIKRVYSNNMLKFENKKIYVDEDLSEVDLTIETNSEEAYIKLDTDTEYTKAVITRKVQLLEDTKQEIFGEASGGWIVNVEVRAEDGTIENHMIYILKKGNTNIKSVKVENTEIPNINDTYTARVNVASKTNVEITSDNTNAKIELIKVVETNDTITENIIATGTGVLTTDVNLTKNPEEYRIRITSAQGSTSYEYDLIIEQKSTNTEISYIKVDDINAIKIENGYKSNVAKKDEYPVVIKVNDENAKVKISYKDYVGKYSQGILNESVPVADRETLEVTITVQAENGNEDTYTLWITRISDNTALEYVKVNGDTYADYNKENNMYSVVVDNTLSMTDIEVKAISEVANIEIGYEQGVEILRTSTILDGAGTEKVLQITVQAEDGTNKTYNLKIIQLSASVSLESIIVNERQATTRNGTDYEVTISSKEELAKIIATAQENTSKVSIADDLAQLGVSTKTIKIEGLDAIQTKILVIAEDGGTNKEYTLTIHIQDSNTNLEYVKVNGIQVNNYDEQTKTYTVIVDNSLTTSELEIKAMSEKATVTIGTNNQIQIITENINLSGAGLTTPVEVFVTAEDGSQEKYIVKIYQRSIDLYLQEVSVNGKIAILNEETGEYTISITEDELKAKITAKTRVGTSKVSIDGNEAVLSTNTKEIFVDGRKTIQVSINVTAEYGKTKEYTLNINVLETGKGLEYVKVDGTTVTDFDINTNKYKVIVDNTLTSSNIEIKTISDVAQITIGEKTETQLITQTISLNGAGKKTNTKIIVTAEDGSQEEYILEIYQLSNDAYLSTITVNGEIAILNEETNKYEVILIDNVDTAKIVATAKSTENKVSIDEGPESYGSNTKTISIDGHSVIENAIKIIAEDGTEAEYTLQIKVLEESSDIEYVRVNTGVISPEEDGRTYKTFIDYDATSANIEIKAKSRYAEVSVTNRKNVSISDEVSENGILSFNVDTPQDITTITFRVTSEADITTEYTIILRKISTDNTLKELYVKGELVEVYNNGNYYYDIQNEEQVLVKAIANNEYANIRIDYEPEEKQQTETTIDVKSPSTKVIITITSQSGTTERYYLYIRVLENNTELDKVIVDSYEVTNYDDTTHTYIAIVDNTKNDYELFLMAVNSEANVELFDGEDLVNAGVGSLTELINLKDEENEHSYRVKVSLDEENFTEYTLVVTRSSSDTSLKLVEVNDVVRQPTAEDKYVYEVGIPKLAQTAKIKVQATNKYATVQIGDNEPVKSGDSVVINLNLADNRITVPVVVTALDGTTINTYNILLLRKSNIAELDEVIVNDNILENIDNVYTYYMPVDEDIAHTQVSTSDENNATIEAEGKEGLGYLEFDVLFDENTIKIEKVVKVTSEDGTVQKEFTIVYVKETKIKGNIITENFENKHISTVELYKSVVQDGEKVDVLVETIQTEENGDFELNIFEIGTYKVKITKLGYLDYSIINIEIVPGSIIELDSYNMKAGNVAVADRTGDSDASTILEQIEIDDLVDLNDNIGVVITDDNKLDKSVYDLNEDGVINILDRNILKKNYGKAEEIVDYSLM